MADTGRYGSVHAPHSREDALRRAWRAAESRYGAVYHQCPEEGEAVMPCCGRTPFEVPRWHRLTLTPSLVNCKGDTPEAGTTPGRASDGGEA